MESFSQMVTIVASLAAIAAPPAALAGLVPRLGPVRAIVLALSTRFRRAQDVSQRTTELHSLRSMLSSVQKAQYVIVSGPKGVGKTCLVDTTLQYTFGVVSVYVAPGTPHDKIKSDAFEAITRSNISFLDHTASAKRVLWWHHFFFRQPATVVLRAAERSSDEPFAALHSAARTLTHDYGARVLIDASNNSLPEAASATKREKLLELEPMRRELLEEIPELQLLLAELKKANLAHTVWMCVGGNPADYKRLLGAWQDDQCNDLEAVVFAFVRSLIIKAMSAVSLSVAADSQMRDLYLRFREKNAVPESVLEELKLVRPSPDKVLRAVQPRMSAGILEGGRRMLIPADAATALVLCTGFTDTPHIDKLKVLAMTPEKELK
jgi:hypothetical protein